MEDKDELSTTIKGRGNGHKTQPSDFTGVVKIPKDQGQLPKEFITPGHTFEEALAKTTIRDPNQLYNIVLLYDQLNEFDEVTEEYPKGIMYNEKQALVNLLIGFNAINGFNKSLAAMTGTGIYLPEGAGIKMSKEDRKALTELQRMKMSQKGKEEDSATL